MQAAESAIRRVFWVVLAAVLALALLLVGGGYALANHYQHWAISIFAAEGEWWAIDPVKGGEYRWTPDSSMHVGPGNVIITIYPDEAPDTTIEWRGHAESVDGRAVPDRYEPEPSRLDLPLVRSGEAAR